MNIYIAQVIHNDVTYNKKVWTSALKPHFNIGEIVEVYLDQKDINSELYVTLGKKDSGKEKLLGFMSVFLFIIGIAGAVGVYFRS